MTVLEDENNLGHNKLSLSKQTISNATKRKYGHSNKLPAKKFARGDMLNGYKSDNNHFRSAGEQPQECPVATLSNMGNTCFLNSLLYTLRFAPTFLHNLHHLIGDLSLVNTRLNQNKAKSSSLGRSIGSISGPSSRSTSSKDLLSLGNYNDIIPKTKVQIVTEKLHELFITMHNLELKESNDAYQPLAFLQAVRDANYIFEGNHQQDAHELLVYLLDNIRETCDILAEQVRHQPELLIDQKTPHVSVSTKLFKRPWRFPGKKKDKNVKDQVHEHTNGTSNTEVEDTSSVNNNQFDIFKRKMGYNFVAEDFEGVTLRRTKCLECESVTERKEPFYDIPVPIVVKEEDLDWNPEEIFKRACVTTEKLCDSNKYLCDNCKRYNEASREVSFEKLPNIMVLHLKRFTAGTNGVEKVNTFLPTPLKLKCFCKSCCQPAAELHHYQLCCLIMHLGGAMASGHYISYVKVTDHLEDYLDCQRELPKGTLSASSSEKSVNFLKHFKSRAFNSSPIENRNGMITGNKHNGTSTCKSMDCCGIKLNMNVVENVINRYNTRGMQERWMMQDAQEDVWLECDDETIRPITTHEFEDLLGNKGNSTVTPYLLFYSKITEASLLD